MAALPGQIRKFRQGVIGVALNSLPEKSWLAAEQPVWMFRKMGEWTGDSSAKKVFMYAGKRRKGKRYFLQVKMEELRSWYGKEVSAAPLRNKFNTFRSKLALKKDIGKISKYLPLNHPATLMLTHSFGIPYTFCSWFLHPSKRKECPFDKPVQLLKLFLCIWWL